MITHNICNNNKNIAILQQSNTQNCVLQSEKLTFFKHFGDTNAKNYQTINRGSEIKARYNLSFGSLQRGVVCPKRRKVSFR